MHDVNCYTKGLKNGVSGKYRDSVFQVIKSDDLLLKVAQYINEQYDGP